MTEPLNLPNDDETIHPATDDQKCFEMERKYGWTLKRIDRYPEQPLFKVDCVFEGDAPFPNYMEDNNDD